MRTMSAKSKSPIVTAMAEMSAGLTSSPKRLTLLCSCSTASCITSEISSVLVYRGSVSTMPTMSAAAMHAMMTAAAIFFFFVFFYVFRHKPSDFEDDYIPKCTVLQSLDPYSLNLFFLLIYNKLQNNARRARL